MLSVAINGCTVHQVLSYHGFVSGGIAVTWVKCVQEVVVTRDSEAGWGTYGSDKGILGGRRGGHIRDWRRDRKKRRKGG